MRFRFLLLLPFAFLAACKTTPEAASPSDVASLRLPIPENWCRLDRNDAVDAKLFASVEQSFSGNRDLLVAAYSCAVLDKLRAGAASTNDEGLLVWHVSLDEDGQPSRPGVSRAEHVGGVDSYVAERLSAGAAADQALVGAAAKLRAKGAAADWSALLGQSSQAHLPASSHAFFVRTFAVPSRGGEPSPAVSVVAGTLIQGYALSLGIAADARDDDPTQRLRGLAGDIVARAVAANPD